MHSKINTMPTRPNSTFTHTHTPYLHRLRGALTGDVEVAFFVMF